MRRTHWHERWDAGRLGFHREQPNEVLDRHLHRLPRGRVLVPLCGKSLDLWTLAEEGFLPVGVELVPKAVEDFFAERLVTPDVETAAHGRVYRGGGVELHVADFFAFQSEPFDAVWDRAALIALLPSERQAYAEHLLRLLRPGGVMLLDVLDYEQSVADGPPWAISGERVRELYGSEGQLELLEEHDPIPLPPHIAEAGGVGRETVWLLTTAEDDD